ncbi:hypothetical protein [Pseudoalteromonas luteoviolacea]|uniref:Uncharacterized protein n=1 Tax=Pseudoalteromonas luteoviolacea H33 TaxID=1365251 RepID=A0A161Y6B5_9GAMM|nr:hypothetical protein [Pseudoalteromonas luteoviolacea]KZN51104.1 hypothetical protein N476_14510 [Pseudoalteromonas luteoviolacea H33]KZN72103.1 hypothetical protein N477_02915 [Pseudoalteromonas luteoviolacea H33-S]MBQ4878489.1 hypothetical protein [Pseudoalteromonas luteoviolacea]MBQ4907644.1 hypothetical protein [Pseudoalteromonas luteoviolacea]
MTNRLNYFSASKVQKVSDNERSESALFAQGKYRAKCNDSEQSEFVQFVQGD